MYKIEKYKNLMNRWVLSILGFFFLVVYSPLTVAITVSTTSFQGNSYNLISDDNGNQWLSLFATTGLSYSTVSTNIADGFEDYANYHFATKSEVLDLFRAYGVTDIDIGQTVANVPFANTFQEDLGITGADTGGGSFSLAYTSDILPGFPSYHVSPIVNLDIGGGIPKASFTTDFNVYIFDPATMHTIGSWLIKNTPILFKNGFE